MKQNKNAQCFARTHEGHPCEKTATKTSTQGIPLCHVHARVKHWRLMLHHDPEPWEWYGFSGKSLTWFLQAKDPTLFKRMRNLCWREPADNDHNGFIYIYTHEKDKDMPFYKIGCTDRHVTTRLKEWSGAQLLRGFGVAHHKLAESILFTLLHPLRVTRYMNKETHTYEGAHYYDNNNEWIVPLPETPDDETQPSFQKHTEWFYFTQSELVLLSVVRNVVESANQWSKRLRKLKRWSTQRTVSNKDPQTPH